MVFPVGYMDRAHRTPRTAHDKGHGATRSILARPARPTTTARLAALPAPAVRLMLDGTGSELRSRRLGVDMDARRRLHEAVTLAIDMADFNRQQKIIVSQP